VHCGKFKFYIFKLINLIFNFKGHYVCYAKNDKNEWVYFNDSKVAASSDPLLGKAYIYIFK